MPGHQGIWRARASVNSNEEPVVQGIGDYAPCLIRIIIDLRHHVEPSRGPVEDPPGLSLPTPADVLVIACHLSEGLLNKGSPKVVVTGAFRENGVSIHEGQVIVDCEDFGLPLNEEVQSNDPTCIRVLIRYENVVNARSLLCHGWLGSQNVAVIQAALDDIVS